MITHNQINSCEHQQSNSYLFSLVLVTLQWLSNRINTPLVSVVVSDLLNHLNSVAYPQKCYLPAYHSSPNSHLCSLSEFSSAFLKDRQMKILTRSASLGQEIMTKALPDLILFLYFLCHENEKLQKSTPRQLNVLIPEHTLFLLFPRGPSPHINPWIMDRTLTPLWDVKSPSNFGYSNHSHSRVFPGQLEKERQKNWTLCLLLK